MSARLPAEIFPPGEFLREELEAREWSQQALADILERPPRLISELIAGKRAITAETAKGLSDAFNTSPDYWMNLESQYQLSKIKFSNDKVARKANLYSRFPVREMLNRGWVKSSEDISVLEHRFCKFFGMSALSDEPELVHHAKKTDAIVKATPLQLAWLFRVKTIAGQQILSSYSPERLLAALDALKALLTIPDEIHQVPTILAQAGVHFVVVEALAGSKIDGACFWLKNQQPVIGMTLRFDRIDNFWFVLRHEIEHVLREDGKTNSGFVIDTDLGDDVTDLSESERLANAAGAEFCVPAKELEQFMSSVKPFFSEEKILQFAEKIRVHPGLVVGQLQRKLGRHNFLRKYQVKVREILLSAVDADGWNRSTN